MAQPLQFKNDMLKGQRIILEQRSQPLDFVGQWREWMKPKQERLWKRGYKEGHCGKIGQQC